ncbi:MAG: RnfABCDGE type electron transport complex subunit D [Myxococcota bacterium]
MTPEAREKQAETGGRLDAEELGLGKLVIASGPFVHEGTTTSRIMAEVLAGAMAVVALAWFYFGVSAVLLVASSTAGAVLTEHLFRNKKDASSIRDGSAALTGVLLALTLPPSLPLWMAFLGGVAAIGLGKLLWGGLGNNLFNPALLGRAFLQAAFPTAMTTWSSPSGPVSGGSAFFMPGSSLAAPFMRADVDAVSAATPLGLFKRDGSITELLSLLTGNVEGSLGETSALLLVICGIWLVARRLCDWRLPVATLGSVYVLSLVLHLIAPGTYPPPLFMLLSGGILFAAVFMVTDPVTTPTTRKGAWIFGIGVGSLVVLIRNHGGLPEGVMYAVLLMNAFVPHIERRTQPAPFGSKPRGSPAGRRPESK